MVKGQLFQSLETQEYIFPFCSFETDDKGSTSPSICQVCSSRQESITVVGQWLRRSNPTVSMRSITLQLRGFNSDIRLCAFSLLHSASFTYKPRQTVFTNQTFTDKCVMIGDCYRGGSEVMHLHPKVAFLIKSLMFSIIQRSDWKCLILCLSFPILQSAWHQRIICICILPL